MKKVIYIAGPFRAENSWKIENNIRIAETFAYKIWSMGAAVICPHANTRFFHGSLPDNVWLDGDMAILNKCDAIVMLPFWFESQGAKKELEFAKSINIPIFYIPCYLKLQSWINGEPNWADIIG